MHVIAIFGILLLISLRLVGLIIAIEFLRDLKESKFKILIIGWFLWIIAGCSALISGIFENQLLVEIFLIINGITTSLALLFVIICFDGLIFLLPGITPKNSFNFKYNIHIYPLICIPFWILFYGF